MNCRCGSFEGAALYELVAQLVEQRPFKAWVLGSIPSELTTLAADFLPRTQFCFTLARLNLPGWECARLERG